MSKQHLSSKKWTHKKLVENNLSPPYETTVGRHFRHGHHFYLGFSLMPLQEFFILVSFLPQPDLLVAVVELPGALPLPDELLRLLLQHVQLALHCLVIRLAALNLQKMSCLKRGHRESMKGVVELYIKVQYQRKTLSRRSPCSNCWRSLETLPLASPSSTAFPVAVPTKVFTWQRYRYNHRKAPWQSVSPVGLGPWWQSVPPRAPRWSC